MIFVYELDGKTYINLTNACTNDCVFCLRNDKDDVCGANLWLEDENFTAADVIAQLKPASEVTFCGYGEPTLRLDILKTVALYIKEHYPDTKIRLNTNGHANAVRQRDIVPELVGLVDEISVSLNAPDEYQYNELSRPKIKNAYQAVLDFIACCAHNKIKTTTTIVQGYKGEQIDVGLCEKVANELGAQLRVREWIPNGY
jgi:TatD family-associated radical SAM protein